MASKIGEKYIIPTLKVLDVKPFKEQLINLNKFILKPILNPGLYIIVKIQKILISHPFKKISLTAMEIDFICMEGNALQQNQKRMFRREIA